MHGRLIIRDDLVQLIGHILHAVGAEGILRAYLPAGAGQILGRVPVVGRVENDLAGRLAAENKLRDRLLERAEAAHSHLVAGIRACLHRGHIVAHRLIFLFKRTSAAAQRKCKCGGENYGGETSFHHFTSFMLSKPLPKTFFASVTMKNAFSSIFLTVRRISAICVRLMTHMMTSFLR